MTATEITHDYIVEKLSAQFPGKILSHEEPYALLSMNVPREDVIEIMRWLKEDAELQFIFMTDLCGVHFPEQIDQELGVVYHLHSFIHNIRLRLRTFFPALDPVVPTASTLFRPQIGWKEKPLIFMAFSFPGHPDLRRILNVDDMTYHPMLKQYPLEDGTRTDKDDKYFGR